MQHNTIASCLVLISALALGACGGDNKDPKTPEPDTSEKIEETGEAVADEVERAAEDAAEGASDAADEVSDELDQDPEPPETPDE